MTGKQQPQIILAFDYGTKRIGIAIGQTVTQLARPLATVQVKQGEPDWAAISKLIEKWQPDTFLVGIPLNMDGTEQPISRIARQFAQQLREKTELPVHEVDERLTTKAAREQLFAEGGYKALQGGQVDQVAAQLMLQAWLDALSEIKKG